ncbi:tetratricopeptide repeat protein [Nocardia asteroides]|nr:tetratricopeptide repeat protein [Nocardia asteroides]
MTAVGRPWRVFLSHTRDLRSKPSGRSWITSAEEAVKRFRHAPVDMKYFAADGRPPAQVCAELVGLADLYVGIIGSNYGSPVPDDPSRSYTELEFDTATAAGKRRLVFLVADDSPRPADARQLAFHARLLDSGLTIARVADPGELDAALTQAIAQLMLDDAMRGPVVAPASRPRPRQLPAAASGFTDRAEDSAWLTALLRGDGTCARSIGIISGPPGVGKSTLAVRVAHALCAEFPDGQLYLDLHGYSAMPASTAYEALDRFVRTLDDTAQGDPELDVERLAQRYRALLDGRRVLVVIDNALTPEQVRPLLPPPCCATVITSRSPLSGLVVRDDASRLVLRPLMPAHAETLLRTATGSQDSAAAAKVARMCGHLPLTLKLAAEHAAVSGMTLGELAAELSNERNRLDALAGVDGDPTSEVRMVFSWSYRNLPHDLRRAFRLLGLHPGDEFSTTAAAALLGVPADRARRILDSLVAFSVLERLSRNRYRLLDLLREYAAERAAEDEPDGARHAALARELDWYAHTVDAADRLLAPLRRHVPLEPPGPGTPTTEFGDYDNALKWCDSERANLVAAIRAAGTDGMPDVAWRLALAAVTFYKIRRHHDDWLTTSELAVTAAREAGDAFAEQWCLTSLGGALVEVGRFEEARSAYEQSLRINRQIGDRIGEGMALGNLGEAARELDRPDYASELGEQALAIWRAIGDRRNEAIVLRDVLAGARFDHGDYPAAERLYRDALAACHGIDSHTEGNVLHDLGTTLQAMLRYGEAADTYEEALAVRRMSGDRFGEAETLYALGETRRLLGDQVGAQSALLQALAVYVESGSPRADEVRARLRELGVDSEDGHGS